jgi:flagellar biosynthesis protein FlhA
VTAALAIGRLLVSGRTLLLPATILTLIALLVLPIPTLLLDIFFVLNILVSLLVLMVALNAGKPLDFSSFPTVLLFATLLRLALNVASTRIVLVSGHEGSGAAGHVIEAFGDFLVGGNFVVGLFVFAILVIINLVVITKGAGRVSEVSARFTLDALPGKQMAIDADLAAGLLTAEEAKRRRQDVATEADFYGAMDGSSKFVKGDAVAALLVLAVNIIGGLVLGVAQHELSFGEAATTYVTLAVGDGLVAQVPALLLSIAAAAIVTRVSSPLDLTGQLTQQFSLGRAWLPAAAILALVGLVPGMPHVLILSFATFAGLVAWRLYNRASVPAEITPATEPERADDSAFDWPDVTDHAPLGLEIGFGLVDFVSDRGGAPLVGRITSVRRQISQALGFLVPQVRIRDSLDLAPGAYRIFVGSVIAGAGELRPDRVLALEPAGEVREIDGIETADPSFGLPARWILPEQKNEAIAAGYTVVDPSTVLATHLSQIAQAHAADLFGQDDAHRLVRSLEVVAPQLAANLVPGAINLPQLTAVLCRLLEERVPVKDFRRIAEAICATPPAATEVLAERVRAALGPAIIQRVAGVDEPLNVVTFSGALEALMTDTASAGAATSSAFEPKLAQEVGAAFVETARALAAAGKRFAIVTTPVLRRPVFQLLRQHLPDIVVLSFAEVPEDRAVEVVSIIGEEGVLHEA